ncbi:ACP S-malonyltransferase [Anaeromicropila populeti]|uniref:[acyl-carrier-protein] S-malonyltransferase n=1 Tax=Anaeromicropila populeti TaxID=37658 RepID=A0A1I6L495_9FIRM|nr:ACP S-malonyltransferase [Anaeromicropila populeti]SFR98070.1 trans-AT polyketide synthase, acyltransferase and oxidoreductase domain-containing protein [Anaeromicropila populeti]
MITYAFPGQGSQFVGMGEELFDLFPDIVEKADAILGYSIRSLCLEDQLNVLGNTQFTQPALFVVNALTYLKEIRAGNNEPDYVLGHSLGEYNALFAAGVFDFETGLKLVKLRGQLMSKVQGGAMAAVLNFPEDKIEQMLEQEGVSDRVSIANYNTPSQIVIAGPIIEINNLKEKMEAAGAKYSILKVSGAFHSRHMKAIQSQFADYIQNMEFREPKIPIISNYTAREYEPGNIQELLLEQLVKPVKWTESIRYLMGKGNMEFKQIGPGFVIKRLIEAIQKNSEPLIVHNFKSNLGIEAFRKEFFTYCNYVVGGMGNGISSEQLVTKLGESKIIGFLGTYGRDIEKVERELSKIKMKLSSFQTVGMNLVYNMSEPEKMRDYFELLYKYDLKLIEISSYLNITPNVVEYRLKGLSKTSDNAIHTKHHIFVKVSRIEVAELFMSPPPEKLIQKLLEENRITKEEAELGRNISVCSCLCIESGKDMDIGMGQLLIESMKKRRDLVREKYKITNQIYIGLAGGIGTPVMAANAFELGAEYITTGSINQCTVEAGTSEKVKNILSEINLFDTTYVPSKILFEWGGKCSVVKKGTFFPYRANKLYELYSQFDNLSEIDEDTKNQLERKYFNKSFLEICSEIYKTQGNAEELLKDRNTMISVFKWYFDYAVMEAIKGNSESQTSFLIYSTPAMGSFNEWVKGSEWEDWRNRHVDEIAMKIMSEAEEIIKNKYRAADV